MVHGIPFPATTELRGLELADGPLGMANVGLLVPLIILCQWLTLYCLSVEKIDSLRVGPIVQRDPSRAWPCRALRSRMSVKKSARDQIV